MSDSRRVTRRLVTCTVVVTVCVVFGIVTSDAEADSGEIIAAAGIAALYSLFIGIAWVIEHKPARRCFILGLATGYLMGIVYTFAVPTGSRLPVVLGPAAGALVGGVLAFSGIRNVRNK